MNLRIYRYALFLFVFFAQQIDAQTTWTGNTSANWNQFSNWSNGLPSPFNEPTIPASPTGPFFPAISVLTYFNFNVQNYGTLKIEAVGGITLFGTFVNHASGKILVNDTSAIFLVETSGILENHGQVNNQGTFSNLGNFMNSLNAIFDNNHIFSHSDGSFSNQGQFNNQGQFFSEADFLNTASFNNHGLFNNNGQASNAGSFTSFPIALLRNDVSFTNQNTGVLTIQGQFLNNHMFLNNGQLLAQPSSVTTNSKLIRNGVGANWNNKGSFSNVLCAIFENKGTHINTGIFENEGFVYADVSIGPLPPVNAGSGVVLTPANSSALCKNFTVSLPLAGPAVVNGPDVANDQFEFCTDWMILLNGQMAANFNGCASLGQHTVNVSFADPFGRTTACPAIVTVVDDVAPSIACQPTQTVPLPLGQCFASSTLAPPTIVQENCSIANTFNDAPTNFPAGQTLVNWTVVDQNGNSSNCTQTVSVVDQIPPTINCPPSLLLNNSPGNCGLSSQDPAIVGNPAFAFDNCGTPVLSNNAGAILPVGTNQLTWTATDSYGNSSSCQQQITVTDVQAPVITACPPDLTVQAQLGTCQAVVSWGLASANDDCGAPNQVFSIPSGSVFDVGTTSVTLTVADDSGNSASCHFDVTVQDSQFPTWTNCPNDTTVILSDCGDMAIGAWTIPMATDACLGSVTSNFQPGAVMPLGPTQVVYTATDLSGNTSTCSFTFTVGAHMAMNCPSDIMVNIDEGTTSSTVNWNTPPGITNCAVCASTDINGFHFLGEKNGHRYYIYLGGQITWQAAKLIAEQHGGNLATISDSAENDLLRKELPNAFNSVWIGLNDQANEGQFVWTNGEVSSFMNWANGGASPMNDQFDFVVLRNDGFWKDEDGNGSHSFIMEVPCYSIDLSASDPVVLSSMVFPLGSTTVSYEYTDNCGNACSCDFNVQVVQNQQVTPCIGHGDSSFGWIESVQTEGFTNTSGDDGGHGDYVSTLFQLPDPGCILRLIPGGPAIDNYLYWRIWADLNLDGDFFDDNELIGSLEGIGEQNFCYDLLANLPTGSVGFRIAMSRWGYAAACGDFGAGESEDYLVSFVDSSSFNPTNCTFDFGLFDGIVEDLKVKLNWIGAGNCDVKEFWVERSSDGVAYEKTATVDAVQQAGQLPHLYVYEDNAPFYGNNFYRIRTVMEDGTELVSGVFQGEFEVDFQSIFIYPNPATTEIILHVFPLNGLPARLFVSNANGQIIFQENYEMLDNEPIKFDVKDFAAGVYAIYLQADGKREQVRRFIVSKP